MNVKKKKTIIVSLTICSVLLVLVGVTYAYWLLTREQEDNNILKTACLNFDLGNQNGSVSLFDVWPMNFTDALALEEEYTFTVTNNCEETLAYTINFESLNIPSIANYLNDNSVDMMIDNIFLGDYGYLQNADAEDSSARSAKKLLTTSVGGVNSGNNTNTHTFKLWVNENAPVSEQGKGFAGKIYVQGGQNIKLLATGDASRIEECDDINSGKDCNIVPVTGNNVTYKYYSDGTLNFEGTGKIKYEALSTILQNIISSLDLTSTEQQIANNYGVIMSVFAFYDISELDQVDLSELANGFTSYNLAFFENICRIAEVDSSMAPAFKSLYDKVSEAIPGKFTINFMNGITSIPYEFAINSIVKTRMYLSSSINELERQSLGDLDIPNELFIPSTVSTFGYGFLQSANIGYLSIQTPIDQNIWNHAIRQLDGGAQIKTLRLSQKSTLTSIITSPGIVNEMNIYIPTSVNAIQIHNDDVHNVNLKFYGPERVVTGIENAKSVTWNAN